MKPPRVSPETAAVILAADRLVDMHPGPSSGLTVWPIDETSPELARLREAVMALRSKREKETT